MKISKLLKPIADEEWQSIAGERISEKYSIIKGDTLSDISKRLFGDARYWPKIWALNNPSITNPHHIRPGRLIAFIPGTGSSLPAVAITSPNGEPLPEAEMLQEPIAESEETTPLKEGTLVADNSSGRRESAGATKKKRSTDWKRLPKQRWENIQIVLPPEVDPLGFDSRNKVIFKTTTDFELEAFSSSDLIAPLATIKNARFEAEYLATGDTVYLEAPGDLEVGRIYAITEEPQTLRSPFSDRSGYSYPILGRVKVTKQKSSLYVGEVVSAKGLIKRGSHLIPAPGRVRADEVIPGPKPIEGIVFLDHKLTTFTVTQHKMVFIDRGTEDGIAPGMVFRSYQHTDPNTENTITEEDFIRNADMVILHASERFCAAMIVNAIGTVTDDMPVVLLTDVSDFNRRKGDRSRTIAPTPTTEPTPAPTPTSSPTPSPETVEPPLEEPPAEQPDDLDALDNGEELRDDEAKELKQLEEWKGNPPSNEPPAPEPPAAAGSGEELSPPPEDLTAPPPIESAPAPPPTSAAPSDPAEDLSPPPTSDEGSLDEMLD